MIRFFAINFILFAVGMYFVLRRPMAQFFAGRARLLAERIADAQTAERAALARLKSIEEKLVRSAAEIASLRDAIRRDGEAEQQALVDRATLAARKMRQDTDLMVGQELRRQKDVLKGTTVDMAILMAERMLRDQIGPDDHVRLARSYVKRLESFH